MPKTPTKRPAPKPPLKPELSPGMLRSLGQRSIAPGFDRAINYKANKFKKRIK